MKDLHSDYADCLEAMKVVTGLSERDVLGTRFYPTPMYRGMIAESLRELGYSTTEIGSVLHRDHSTVTHMLKRLKSSVGCAGFQAVTSVYKAYGEALKRQRDESSGKVTISQMAEGYLGIHCRRDCANCRVRPESCRYIQDEGIFVAGAGAQISLIRHGLERLKQAVAKCQLLCGNGDVIEAIDNLESIISQ